MKTKLLIDTILTHIGVDQPTERDVQRVQDFLTGYHTTVLLRTGQEVEISDLVRTQINEALNGVHSWAKFCLSNKITYHDLINLKHGRVKFHNAQTIHICNTLKIDPYVN